MVGVSSQQNRCLRSAIILPTPEEAKELAVRAVKFKKERGRLPSISSTDAWEKRMAEGAAAFVRFKDEGRYE